MPRHVYGGLLVSLLDCHGAAAASGFAHRARRREVGDGGEPLRFVTGTAMVIYRRPRPMGVELPALGQHQNSGDSHEAGKHQPSAPVFP